LHLSSDLDPISAKGTFVGREIFECSHRNPHLANVLSCLVVCRAKFHCAT